MQKTHAERIAAMKLATFGRSNAAVAFAYDAKDFGGGAAVADLEALPELPQMPARRRATAATPRLLPIFGEGR